MSPNRSESLSSCKDHGDDFLSDRQAFNKKYALVPTNVIEKSVRLGNSNTITNTQQILLKSPNLS